MIKLNIIKQIFYIHIFYKIIALNSNNFITKNSIISNTVFYLDIRRFQKNYFPIFPEIE